MIEQQSDNDKKDRTPDSTEKPEQDPSVENGKKIIEMQKKLEDKPEEEHTKDAEKWRNEG